jgi:ABC-2 type transport system permease protein
MRHAWAVYRRELRSYFVSPIPYVLLVIFPGFMGWFVFFQANFFMLGRATMDAFFDFLPWPFIVIVPAISMRLWSEEIRAGTIETLLTSAARPWTLVAGKFLAAWTVLAVVLAGTIAVPITVSMLGDVDGGTVTAGYVGAWLMGGAFLAMGLWISGLTRHQIVAFLITAAAAFLFVVMRYAARGAFEEWRDVFAALGASSRYESMGRGVVDLRDVLYFVSFATLFLYMNAQSVGNRRYR